MSPQSFEKMITPTVLESGEVRPYGYGLMIGENPQGKRIAHGGGIFGFNSQLSYYPERGLTIAVLSNSNGLSAGGVESALAKMMHETE